MIFIGIPTRGVIYTDTSEYLYDVVVTDHSGQIVLPPFFTNVAPVSMARNLIVEKFMASEADYLYMIDDDEVPPLGVVQAMIAKNAPVVVIDCPSKHSGKSNIFKNDDGTIAATGFGCALFKREVFQRLQGKWFDLYPRRTVEKSGGKWVFPILDDAPPNSWGGEDINFCMKLQEHGIPIITVEGAVCTHLEAVELQKEHRATEILTINRYDTITGSPL